MALLANSRGNHLIHLALLGVFLFFEFLTLAICGAFIARGKSQYYGYYFDASGLIVAASVFSILATGAFLVFNTVGSLFQGMKNSIMVELGVYTILFILNLAGAATLSSDGWQFECSSKSCQLAKATLAFAWLSTLTLILLLAFLLTWTLLHRKRRGETSIFSSSIKAYHVDGEPGSRGGDTAMSYIAPSTSMTGVRATTPVVVTEPARV